MPNGAERPVDFVDALCIEVTEALSASTAAQAPVEEKKEEKKETKVPVNLGTTVIGSKTQVTVETLKATATTPATVTAATLVICKLLYRPVFKLFQRGRPRMLFLPMPSRPATVSW